MLVAVMFKVRTGHLARIAVLLERVDLLQVGSVSLTKRKILRPEPLG